MILSLFLYLYATGHTYSKVLIVLSRSRIDYVYKRILLLVVFVVCRLNLSLNSLK